MGNTDNVKDATTKKDPKKEKPNKNTPVSDPVPEVAEPKKKPNKNEDIILQINLKNLLSESDDPDAVEYGYDECDSYEEEAVMDLMEEITNWLSHETFAKFCNEIKKRVIGQDNLEIVLANVYNYLVNISSRQKINNNMLMAAPSGCGKTETYRALKEYFKKWIPSLVVSQIDVSIITEEGVVGAGSSLLVDDLIMSDTGGYGIIFMDEFDKKLIPSFVEGSNASAAVQNQLLTIIEGREVQEMFEGQPTGYSVDTSKTMFIGLGSFNHSREQKKQAKSSLGFGTNVKENDYFEDITREDMIKMGASYEMIGRFPLIVNYHRLSKDAVDQIINKTVSELSQAYQVPITLSTKMREYLHEQSNGVYGCRMIDSCIRDQVIKRYTELLLQPDKYARPVIIIQSVTESCIEEFVD